MNKMPEMPEVPWTTPEIISRTVVNLTKEWTGLDIGCIMKRKETDDGQCYIFLGLIDESDYPDEDLRDVMTSTVPPKRRLGWFTRHPIRINRKGYESEITICCWFIDLFETVIPGPCSANIAENQNYLVQKLVQENSALRTELNRALQKLATEPVLR